MHHRIQVKYSSTTTTAVAAEDILTDLHIQVCLLVIAKWTSAMQLGAGIAHHLDANQIDDILDVARHITG